MKFRSEFWFLSNMYPCNIVAGKHTFLCVESAFQACKAPSQVNRFASLNGFEAKKAGRSIRLEMSIADWNVKRVNYMYSLLKIKFQNAELAEKLKAIEGPIVEENDWGDTFWGVCNGKGENMLGKLLMKVRAELQAPPTLKIQYWDKPYTRASIAKLHDSYFLFGDNYLDAISGYVPTATQAVIRGLPNAIGIPTKKSRAITCNAYLSDTDFDRFKDSVDSALLRASELQAQGYNIYAPKAGIGTGKAQLKARAPKCYDYLVKFGLAPQ